MVHPTENKYESTGTAQKHRCLLRRAARRWRLLRRFGCRNRRPIVFRNRRGKRAAGRCRTCCGSVADQQRFDTIAGLNNPHIHTPNLDKLMSESTTFTHAFVQNSVCSPSRASFLTGRYPHTTGLRANGQRIHAERANWSRAFWQITATHAARCGKAAPLSVRRRPQ